LTRKAVESLGFGSFALISHGARGDDRHSRVFSDLMGREGIEPATLGLKVDVRLLRVIVRAGQPTWLSQNQLAWT